jgi:hypothetical protein
MVFWGGWHCIRRRPFLHTNIAFFRSGHSHLRGSEAMARAKRWGRRKRKGGRVTLRLTVLLILSWADDHFAHTGRWPCITTGFVLANRNEKWHRLDEALNRGYRGLPKGSSLAKLLRDKRGVRNPQLAPPLTQSQILKWARAHQQRTGAWPTQDSGDLPDVPAENWGHINMSLWAGRRGLPGGDSLAQLLARHVGRRNFKALPPLSIWRILQWADEHKRRTGEWPKESSGQVLGAAGERWSAIAHALGRGRRGLPGGSSLAVLLGEHRGKRNRAHPPLLQLERVLSWAKAHHKRTGRWPTALTGPIPEASGESWNAIDKALMRGRRGLPGGLTLAQLLRERHGSASTPRRKPPK